MLVWPETREEEKYFLGLVLLGSHIYSSYSFSLRSPLSNVSHTEREIEKQWSEEFFGGSKKIFIHERTFFLWCIEVEWDEINFHFRFFFFTSHLLSVFPTRSIGIWEDFIPSLGVRLFSFLSISFITSRMSSRRQFFICQRIIVSSEAQPKSSRKSLLIDKRQFIVPLSFFQSRSRDSFDSWPPLSWCDVDRARLEYFVSVSSLLDEKKKNLRDSAKIFYFLNTTLTLTLLWSHKIFHISSSSCFRSIWIFFSGPQFSFNSTQYHRECLSCM